MDGGPRTVRIFQPGRDFVPAFRLVRFDNIEGLGFHAEVHTEVTDVGNWIGLLGEQLRQGLPGILVIEWNVISEICFDRLQHRRPIGPLRRAIVANDIGSLCRRASGDGNQNSHGETQQHLPDRCHLSASWGAIFRRSKLRHGCVAAI